MILKMFSRINIGERAGSGVDKILTAWQEQKWKIPEFDALRNPAPPAYTRQTSIEMINL